MSFKRTYAFEAEGVSEEVKMHLEAVEKSADDKCSSPADCDKILDKIDTQAEKFDSALSEMADAAKDCKDGKCDEGEMASRITPAQAELKAVAKTIGVASEAEGVTEEELKDVKDYLEGAKEIIEAKKDELEDGCDHEDADGDGKCDKCGDDVKGASEGFCFGIPNARPAMEGANWQAFKAVAGGNTREASKLRKQAKKALKAGNADEAKRLLTEAKGKLNAAKAELQKLPKDMWDTISSWVNCGLLPLVFAIIGEGFKESPNANLNVAGAIGYFNRAIQAIDKQIAACGSGSASKAEECWILGNDAYDREVEAAMESYFEAMGEPLNMSAAMEGNNIEAFKAAFTGKAHEARKLRNQAKKALKAGNADEAKRLLTEAKGKLNEVKSELQKLPKDAFSTVLSWLQSSGLAIIFAIIGEGFKEAPNANLNVAGAIGYVNRAIQAIDKQIAACGSGSASAEVASKAEECWILGNDAYDRVTTAAMESYFEALGEPIPKGSSFRASGSEIDNFVAACESLKIGSRSISAAGSFLFGD